MAPRYLSRARMKTDATVKALVPLLLGKGRRSGGDAGHHLVWSLFADSEGRQRDFLWREMVRGEFLILSARPPEDRHGLFDLAEPKRFEPDLAEGDRLAFSLRANPVIRRMNSERGRAVKHDVVMDALKHGEGERAEQRLSAIHERGFAWLDRQGKRTGFSVRPQSVRVEGYEQHRVRRNDAQSMFYSTLDYDGVLTVASPNRFLDAVVTGFGSAKAYGCGLMLLRRAEAR